MYWKRCLFIGLFSLASFTILPLATSKTDAASPGDSEFALRFGGGYYRHNYWGPYGSYGGDYYRYPGYYRHYAPYRDYPYRYYRYNNYWEPYYYDPYWYWYQRPRGGLYLRFG